MSLDGLRVLILEDELLVAIEIEALLAEFGCEVVGPVATVSEALDLIRARELDGAVLDINLHGEHAYPVAEALQARAVPFVFVTGYTEEPPDTPPALRGAPRLNKPFSADRLADAVARACGRAPTARDREPTARRP